MLGGKIYIFSQFLHFIISLLSTHNPTVKMCLYKNIRAILYGWRLKRLILLASQLFV